MLTNGDLETGAIAPWTASQNTGSSAINSNLAYVHAASYSAKVTTAAASTGASGVSGGGNCSGGVRFAVLPSTSYTWSAWILVPAGTPNFTSARVRVAWYAGCSGGSQLATADSSLVTSASGTWVRVTGTATSAATAAYGELRLYGATNPANAVNIYFDDISFDLTSAATNPSGAGLAAPATVNPGDATLLTVAVTPGANPASSGLAVTCDLTALGGSSNQTFYDDGTHGDVTAGDNIFSEQANVPLLTAPGLKTMPCAIADGQARNGGVNINLNVTTPPTNPTGVGSASPSAVLPGDAITLTVTATPGSNPASATMTVTCNLTPIGGSNPVTFTNSVTTVFTYNTTVNPITPAGNKALSCNIVDDLNRTGSATINLTVLALLPIGTVNGAVADLDNGALHRSPYAPPSGNGVGSTVVTVRGVIYEKTYQAIANSLNYYNSFFIQNTAATADGNPNTSDGLYVFMSTAATLPGPSGPYTPTVGDEIILSGSISEYYYMTEMQSPGLAVLQVVRSGVNLDAELPAFDANPPPNVNDANRYWERRQSMRGQIPANSIVLNGRNVFSPADAEIWVARPDSTIAGRSNPFERRAFRDAQPLDDNYDPNNWDGNGYRILMGSWGIKYTQDDAQALLNPARTFMTVTNALVGGVNYSFNKYRFEVTTQPTLVNGVDPAANNPPLVIDRTGAYSIADYNLENLYDYRDNPFSGCDFTTDTGCSNAGTPFLSPINPPFDYVPVSASVYITRLNDIALEIINDLHSPDILMTQEVENQDICSVSGGVLVCGVSDNADGKPDVLQELALKIAANGGPVYDAAFDRDSADLRGIVPAYLYRTDRVQLLPAVGDPVLGISPTIGSYIGVPKNANVSNPKTLNAVYTGGSPCETSWIFPRAPDIALFRIYQTSIGVGKYNDVYLIDNHFKSGPDSCVAHRTEQAKYNAALTQYIQANNPNARVIVGGDLNVYPRPDDPVAPPAAPTDQLGSLYAANLGLKNLWQVLLANHPEAAYSYVYLGQAQTLDQMFVNRALLAALQDYRVAHINSDFPADYFDDVARGTSDHDPNVAVFNFVLDTTTTLTASANPSLLGQSVTFTAQVTSTSPITPTGTITFAVDADAPFAQALVNGSTAFATSALAVGTHVITATYGGDMNYNGSAKSGAQNVQYAMPTIASLNPTSAPINGPTFTLVVTGTGFANGASVIRWNGVDHPTTFISSTQLSTTIQKSELAAAGTVTVTVFNPTPGGGQATPPLTFSIGQGSTQVTLAQSVEPSVWQQAVTFTATVTQTFPLNSAKLPRDVSPSGTITFTDSVTGSPLCGGVAMSNWQALCSTSALTVGLHSIIATFSGDANYASSTASALSHTVNKANTQILIASSLNPSSVGQPITFTASVGLNGGSKSTVKAPSGVGCLFDGTVQFKDGLNNLGAAQALDYLCQATLKTNTLAVGTHPITAVYSGDANYNGSSSNQVNQVVNFAKLFLPLLQKNFAYAPNLVVDNLIVAPNDVQVVIKNTGAQPVVNEFWVDLYINPGVAPTQVNQTWSMLGSQGIVWGVTAAALPINPGETRTLSIANDPNRYYAPALSSFSLPLANATIYVQVDSANAGVWYGAVLENHEITGMPYDNIRRFNVTNGMAALPALAPRDPTAQNNLPIRP